MKFKGAPAHASEPGKGSSAIKAASKAVISLEDFDENFEYENDMLPEPDLSATILEGGETENQIPETAELTIDRRVVPPETPGKFAGKIRSHLERRIDEDVTIEESGNGAQIFEAATEASRFNESNVVVFGPGVLADEEGGVAHSNREYIKKDKIEEAGKVTVSIVESYLK